MTDMKLKKREKFKEDKIQKDRQKKITSKVKKKKKKEKRIPPPSPSHPTPIALQQA
jgi:hypothetical protein